MPKFVDPYAVRNTFDYDQVTGRLIRKIGGKGGGKIGDIAGYEEEAGNRRTWFKNRLELTARMVWAWHYGESPEQPIVHVNGDKSDDRIENLKTRQQLTKDRKIVVSQESLRQLFDYVNGELVRKVKRSHNADVGQVAGNKRKRGDSAVHIGGRLYLNHRLIWLYHHGAWPEGEIDHINRDPSDNRIENLRDVVRAINSSNRPVRKDCRVGIKGVSRSGSKFFSRIALGNGKTKHLGTFDTPEEAHQVFKRAHAERYGPQSEYFEELKLWPAVQSGHSAST